MRIRPYIESNDYPYLEKWIDNEKIHALWCANTIPYPIEREGFRAVLEKNAHDRLESAYVATENDGEVVGFFCYNLNVKDNCGYLKFVIVNHEKRGKGYGTEMLRLALKYAFEITGVDAVRLIVFEHNAVAKHCYEKAGFYQDDFSGDGFAFHDELWSKCHMIIRK